jgi:hypothetical protein
LGTGVKSLRRIYAEDGLDFEDELPAMAADYGVSEAEMRAILLNKHFAVTGAADPLVIRPRPATDAPTGRAPPPRNGNGRITRLGTEP